MPHGRGDVLVFDCGGFAAGYFRRGVIDMMAHACQAKGIAGVVIDGTNRDCKDILTIGLPVFSRGASPAGTTKVTLGKVGVTVCVGGVTVRTGDVVFADCDGVVVVPRERERMRPSNERLPSMSARRRLRGASWRESPSWASISSMRLSPDCHDAAVPSPYAILGGWQAT